VSLAAGLAIVALLVATGWGPAARQPASGVAGRLARAFAWGAAIVGLVQLALGVLGVRAGLAAPLVLGGAGLAAAWRGRGTARRARVDEARSGLVAPRALWTVALACLLVGASATAGLPLRADGRTFWAPKARELSRVPAAEAPMLRDPTRLAMHRDYPLLVPALLAPAFGLAPDDAQAGPKLVLYAFVAAGAVLLVDRLGRGGARAQALALAFVTMPILVRTEVRESIAVAGYVDAPLALFVLMLVDAVDRWRMGALAGGASARPTPAVDRAGACLFGAACVATKLEGATALAVVATAWALAGPRRLPVLGVVAAAIVLASPSIALVQGVPADNAIVERGWLTDPSVWTARIVPVVAGLLGLLVDASRFALLPLLLVTCWPRGPRRAFCSWMALGLLAVMALAYVGTTMHVGRHVYTSAHRLAFQWLPALVLLAGLAARDEGAGATTGEAASAAPGGGPPAGEDPARA